ncbi:hypothetical protein GCM10010974_32520 [Brevibacterium sediminis]|uniref:Uncharacterized protein n=1 Tax=Brevibacterium sediminis TaxID=1857024 RepID=A0ABQ1MVQ6_9MICO|nr:hypothetical protein GCM10010974_32520 [Brevibacterium sediminis]
MSGVFGRGDPAENNDINQNDEGLAETTARDSHTLWIRARVAFPQASHRQSEGGTCSDRIMSAGGGGRKRSQ